jgi:hypothetical protein
MSKTYGKTNNTSEKISPGYNESCNANDLRKNDIGGA